MLFFTCLCRYGLWRWNWVDIYHDFLFCVLNIFKALAFYQKLPVVFYESVFTKGNSDSCQLLGAICSSCSSIAFIAVTLSINCITLDHHYI